MTIATTHIWTLLVCLLFFISGITSCDSSDLDKLPVNENPEVAFVNDDVPQRLSLNNARLKRMTSPASDSAHSGKIYEYNDEGQLSRISNCLFEGETITDTLGYNVYQYNVDKQLVMTNNFNANKNTSTGFINLQTQVYIYSNDGKLEKKITHYPVISQSEYTLYKYKNNMLDRKEHYGTSGVLENYTTHSYDKVGKLILECHYMANNQLINYTQHSFIDGLNTRSVTFSPTGEALRKVINTYDSNYNLIRSESSELVLYSSRSNFTAQYEYDNAQ